MAAASRTLTGPFQIEPISGQVWCLRAAPPAAAAVLIVRGPAPASGDPHPIAATIEWDAVGRAALRLEFPSGSRDVPAASLLLHEPLPALYAALPLAAYDARARRFWRRVFAVVRLPGARYVLRLFARRARASG
jgi:hypothetical protein